MSSSYQKSGPRRIEEIGVTPEELARRKSNRRLLFTGVSAAVVLTFIILAAVVMNHQKLDREYETSTAFGIASLSSLSDNTNVSVASGCETTIILGRHCEKTGSEIFEENGDEHCSYVGLERAQYLKTLFGPGGWPIPSVVYALSPKRANNMNFREVETVRPLADEFGLTINTDFSSNKHVVEDLYARIASGNMCGKTALISWKHDKMGDLARKLSCNNCLYDYPEDQFDQVWQLKYVYDAEGTIAVGKVRERDSVTGTRRNLRKNPGKKHKRHSKKKLKQIEADGRGWTVYSAIVYQGFDPLKFSTSAGDYDSNLKGGSWFPPTPIDGDEEM